MADETLWPWRTVRDALAPLGRGAPYRLAQQLGMNPSYFYRKLKTEDDLTQRQAQVVRGFLADAEALPPPIAQPPPENARRVVPVYGYAAAGGRDTIALNEGDVVETMLLPFGLELGPGEWFVVRALGSSMEPRIFAGDALLVRRRSPAASDKDVLVELTDGTGLVKLYKGERDGRVFLEQLNPRETISLDATGVRAIHGGVIKL